MTQISGRHYKFQDPSAIEAVGTDLFVANAGGNSVTKFSASNLRHVHIIHRQKFDLADPVALATSGPDLFVLNGGGIDHRGLDRIGETDRDGFGGRVGSMARPGSPSPTGASSWPTPTTTR